MIIPFQISCNYIKNEQISDALLDSLLLGISNVARRVVTEQALVTNVNQTDIH